MNSQQGFTLIEVIIFTVVIGIISVSIFASFNQILIAAKNPETIVTATQLAKERMELILGQRETQGFSAFTDPCTAGGPASVCNLPSGFSITQPTISGDKLTITVTVDGPEDTHVTLVGQVENE